MPDWATERAAARRKLAIWSRLGCRGRARRQANMSQWYSLVDRNTSKRMSWFALLDANQFERTE